MKDLLGNNPSKHSKLLYFKNMFETHLSLKEITRLTEIYWESFIQKADISKEVIEKLDESPLTRFLKTTDEVIC